MIIDATWLTIAATLALIARSGSAVPKSDLEETVIHWVITIVCLFFAVLIILWRLDTP